MDTPPSLARKYSKIIFAILIFIFLDLGVLALNFYLSYQIQNDAVSVNLAGRQRMLSQRTVKALYQIQSYQQQNQPIDVPLKELAISEQLFDKTLAAFLAGGDVMGTDQKMVTLAPVTDETTRKALTDASALWIDYRTKLSAVLNAPTPITDDLLNTALSEANDKNLSLLNLMNQLTTDLEKTASARASLLRKIQTGAMILVLLNFIYIIFDVLAQLRKLDRIAEKYAKDLQLSNDELTRTGNELALAQKESDLIFSSVRQGLFLIHPNLTIGQKVSGEVSSIFGQKELSGRSFLHLLKPLITPKLYQTTTDYFGLLFDASKRKKDLQKFNPLTRIEANFNQPTGGFQTRYLEFNFEQISGAQGIERVLVSVIDNTGQVRLMNQIKETEEKAKNEFNLLIDILQVESLTLKEFIENAGESLLEINQTLKLNDLRADEVTFQRPALDRIYRLIHNLKANAASLGLGVFTEAAHKFEEALSTVREKFSISGEDFLPAILALGNLQSLLEETRVLIKKISRLNRTFQPTARPIAVEAPVEVPPLTVPAKRDDSWKSSSEPHFITVVNHLSQELSTRMGKKAKIDWKLDPQLHFSPARATLLRDVLLQFVRNSYVHGFENEALRQERGKSTLGSIIIEIKSIKEPKEEIHLLYRDDGQGLPLKMIQEKAIAQGLLAPNTAVDQGELCALIFASGFSTAPLVTTDAGRGIGLDIVRELIVEEAGGDISIETMDGQYLEFLLTLPI